MVSFDSTLSGTPVSEWEGAEQFRALPPFDWTGIDSVAVVAAHPDDETLGAGGLIAECHGRGIPVTVISVTDGRGSHPGSRRWSPDEVAAVRDRELRRAISELAPDVQVIALNYPDGQTQELRDTIAISLERHLASVALIVSPWRGDGHRDHRIVGEICAALATRDDRRLVEYPVWMWHWAAPDDERVPWERCVLLSLSDSAREAKRRATSAYVSQVVGLGSAAEDGPVLRADFLNNFDRGHEMFIMPGEQPDTTKPAAYFDDIYSRHSDPWHLATRWYEARKRAVTLASLPRQRFSSTLEIGCSVGELSAALAERTDQLLAIDISSAAVDAAARRTQGMPGVRVERCDATVDFPEGPFDLIVVSEVAYYWDRATLIRVLGTLASQLVPDGTVLACHWRHPVTDYPLSGDEVHRIVRSELRMNRVATHDETDFLLEVFADRPESVAEVEGLLK